MAFPACILRNSQVLKIIISSTTITDFQPNRTRCRKYGRKFICSPDWSIAFTAPIFKKLRNSSAKVCGDLLHGTLFRSDENEKLWVTFYLCRQIEYGFVWTDFLEAQNQSTGLRGDLLHQIESELVNKYGNYSWIFVSDRKYRMQFTTLIFKKLVHVPRLFTENWHTKVYDRLKIWSPTGGTDRDSRS